MNLQLSLKTEWFEMTKAGIKTEDYREITTYWIRRLLIDVRGFELVTEKALCRMITEGSKDVLFQFKYFDTNTMTLGYPKKGDTERIIQFEHTGIEIRTGNPEWGAEPGKLYFVIKHGKQLKQKEDKK